MLNIARNDTSGKYWNLKEWARYMPNASVSSLMKDAVKAALKEQREEFDESDSD